MPWDRYEELSDTLYRDAEDDHACVSVEVDRNGHRYSEGEGYCTSYCEDLWEHVAGTVILSWGERSHLDIPIETGIDDDVIEWLYSEWGINVYEGE